jgi:hypothetical protein
MSLPAILRKADAIGAALTAPGGPFPLEDVVVDGQVYRWYALVAATVLGRRRAALRRG